MTPIDIPMDQWKNNRFVAIDRALSQELGLEGPDSWMVIMTDVKFWAAHVDECISWCHENGCKIQGMTIEIPNSATMTLFGLRWAG